MNKEIEKQVIQAKNMVYGMIYVSTPAGEFQRDKDGRYWWKKCDGSIQEINPHPDSMFTELKEIER